MSVDGYVAVVTRRRKSDIKHGCVGMLATMGYTTPDITGKSCGYLDRLFCEFSSHVSIMLQIIDAVHEWNLLQAVLRQGAESIELTRFGLYLSLS